jgi:two-component system, LytTR family, response regulator
MIKAILVDDERKSSLTLQKLLGKYCEDFIVAGQADNLSEAYELIRKEEPDVVFLDIEMADGTGFDLLKKFDDPFFHFIFVTAHSNYAVKAFRFSAVDYLLKPVDIDDLKNAANKIRKAVKNGVVLNRRTPEPGEMLKLRTKKDFLFVSTDQIVSLQAQGSYTLITMVNKEKHTVSVNLGLLEEKIHDKNFIRIHRSDIININYIRRIIKKEGSLFAELEGNHQVEISRRNRTLLFGALEKSTP